MRWKVEALYVTEKEETFYVNLPDGFKLAEDLGGNLTSDRNDVLVCEDGSIVALPVSNLCRLRYSKAEPTAPSSQSYEPKTQEPLILNLKDSI